MTDTKLTRQIVEEIRKAAAAFPMIADKFDALCDLALAELGRRENETAARPDHGNVSTIGNGKVSVPVADIVKSPKVQRQVQAVRELIAAAPAQEPVGMPEDMGQLFDELSWYRKKISGTDHNGKSWARHFEEELTALRTRCAQLSVEECGKDAERLEFIVLHPEYRVVQGKSDGKWTAMDCSNGLTFIGRHYQSMREAVDAALAQHSEEKK